MPFFLTIEDFLPLAGAAFLANFLLASLRDFMPCLSFGFMQPQVAHITSSSFVGQRSQSLLACRLCLYQAFSALETSSLEMPSLQSSCRHPYSLALNSHIRMICTYYLLAFLGFATFFLPEPAGTQFGTFLPPLVFMPT